MKIKFVCKTLCAAFLAFAMAACSASFSTNVATNTSNSASSANSNTAVQNKTSNTNSQNTAGTNSQNKTSDANSDTTSKSTPKKEFTIYNKTKSVIKEILVSEDGKDYSYFDIGTGIPAGSSETLVWDKATDKEKCTQFVKAVYADGAESEPVKFDFCAEKLELDFEE